MSPVANDRPAEDPELDPDFEPEDTRFIRDVETLRALSDATRMRMLETMVQRRRPAWSVKELATALGMPQTRLYHHVELLLERDLIRATERRVVSGIIETRYTVTARSFQLDRALFAADSATGLEVLHETLAAVFDTARAEVELAVRLGAIDVTADAPVERRLMVQRGLVKLPPARATELRERLVVLLEEYGGEEEAPDAVAYGLVMAIYPMPPSGTDTQEPTDG
ncbi:MAG TPA: helix-turn-helix domain-containing protein [Candidatus Limnocylindrales bacterium]|nr:helix-turn-helix domain-containing protein [Candidatus Limnocylindrales bacterium]